MKIGDAIFSIFQVQDYDYRILKKYSVLSDIMEAPFVFGTFLHDNWMVIVLPFSWQLVGVVAKSPSPSQSSLSPLYVEF